MKCEDAANLFVLREQCFPLCPLDSKTRNLFTASAAILIKMRRGLHKENAMFLPLSFFFFLFRPADFDYSREIATFREIQ